MLYLIVGLIIGALLVYFYLRPRIHKREQYNKDIAEQNQALSQELKNLTQEANKLNGQNNDLKDELLVLSKEVSSLEAKKNETISNISELQRQAGQISTNITQLQGQAATITSSISSLQEQAEKAADQMYQKSIELASSQMELATQKMSEDYRLAEQQASEEYAKTLYFLQEDFQQEIESRQEQLAEVTAELADLQAKLDAVVEQQKRQLEVEQKQDFYRLQLSLLDVEEIKKIRSITPYLRNAEPVNKVIWKVYYEKPYTDLIGRVIGQGTHTGIYKITNVQNGMCYVGQAVDLASRWKQHIRRGVGADTPTQNKLYPAMQEIGPENFTFEVLEECSKAELNTKELEYQQMYHARDYGYSIK